MPRTLVGGLGPGCCVSQVGRAEVRSFLSGPSRAWMVWGWDEVSAPVLPQMEIDCLKHECLSQGVGTRVPRKLDLPLTWPRLCHGLEPLKQSRRVEAKAAFMAVAGKLCV